MDKDSLLLRRGVPMVGVLKKTKVIVTAYIVLKVVQSAYAVSLFGEIGGQAVGFKFLDLITIILLVFFTDKDKIVAKWILAALILFSGVHGFIMGIFAVPLSQYVLKPLFIILGIYFSFGGILLIKKTKNKEIWD